MQVKKCEKMIYNKEAGCVYDTIFYCMLEFSKESYEKYLAMTFGVKNSLEFYEEVKKERPALPQELYPFFFRSNEEWCFLSQYHWENFNNFTDSYIDFKNKIKADKDINQKLFRYYLKELYDKDTLILSNPSKLFFEILNLELDKPIVQQLVNFYYNFESIINSLTEYLQYVYDKILELHTNSQQIIQDTIKKYSSKKMLSSISAFCNIKENIDIDKNIIFISLINTYLCLWEYTNEEKHGFILGLDADEFIASLIYYKNINPEWIGKITSHPVKSEILEYLRKGNYSATQLAEIMYISRQTVNFHLLELKTNMCVRVAEKRGAELLYSINSKFFEAAQFIMNKHLNKFIK